MTVLLLSSSSNEERGTRRMRDSARSTGATPTASTTTWLVKSEEFGEGSYLDFISLPIIRLDEFEQDELRLLAEFSGDFPEARFQNIVIPKIDRRIFNESAGSRRQTYGKCFASRHWNTGSDDSDDTEDDEEDSEPARSRSRGRPRKKQKKERKVNVPEKTRSAKAVARVIVERKERLRIRDTSSQGGKKELHSSSAADMKVVSWIRRIQRQNPASDSSDVSDRINLAEKTTMTTTMTTSTAKRGRPRKPVSNGLPINASTPDSLADNSSKKPKQEISSLEIEEISEEGLGRRTRKRRASTNYSVGSGLVDGRESKRRADVAIMVGRNGEIGPKDDTVKTYYGEEELMEILRQMKGKWSSAQMKRKFVDATGFPKGWTVLVGMRHANNGRAYFDYREWRSPEGRIWTSYKEAAAYLLSTVGKDISIEGELSPSFAGQEDGCEQNTLAVDGENDLGQNLVNSSSFAALLHAHDSQLFFEPQAEGGLHSLERNLSQDLQDLDQGAREASTDHSQPSGGHLDKFLRVSCRSDNVAISTQAFGEQVTIKMEPSKRRAYRGSSRNLLGTDRILKNRQSDCEVQDLNVCVNRTRDAKPEECQSAREVEGSKDRRESFDDLLENKLDDRGNSMPLNRNSLVLHRMQTVSHERGHVCRVCGTSFLSSYKLRRHMRRSKHLKVLNCEVCRKKFTSLTHLLGHRLKMGHLRVSKEHPGPNRMPAENSKTQEKVSQSVMSNIVFGLLSDVRSSDQGRNLQEPCTLRQPANRPMDKTRGAGNSLPSRTETVKGKVVEVPSCEKPDVFKCQVCHKVFNHQSRFWGHLSAHSSKKKGKVVASPKKRLNRPRTLQDTDGVYECDVCHKIFNHQSKFWGHSSMHSRKKRKAPHSSTLLDPESERLVSRTVEDPEPNVMELDSCSNGVEMGPIVNQCHMWEKLPPAFLPRVPKRRGRNERRKSWLQGPVGYEHRTNSLFATRQIFSHCPFY
ncbi:hypothetical protein R1sor_019936 [Riccia sorocarpa]|uniref:C2H2-type domain-containing protein n=1 Tax=Riccia sorocarpa TaxID=122646 RepID=A0ABD3IK69_9MARC